jgi:hypothetical protein
MKLEDLILEAQGVLDTKWRSGFYTYVDVEKYEIWRRKALMFLQEYYPMHPQVKDFEEIATRQNNNILHCEALLGILKAFQSIKPSHARIDYEDRLSRLFERFHIVARQLRRRYDGRTTLAIHDEYDVQDLLHGLLRIDFEDVRPEEWTPSYAGSSNRIDFLLKEGEIAIEVKMTRDGLKDRELGEQLIIDIAKYQSHPNCKCLYCFVYDPENNVRNPRGLDKDLAELGKEFLVKVFIRPE